MWELGYALKVKTIFLLILKWIGSQWNATKTGVMYPRLLVQVKSLAAEFRTTWSRSSSKGKLSHQIQFHLQSRGWSPEEINFYMSHTGQLNNIVERDQPICFKLKQNKQNWSNII